MKLYLSILLAVILLAAHMHNASAQYITTFAGTPITTGYTGDGGPATDAVLYSPSDVALDKTGNLYIADFINNVIRRVDTFGIIRTIAGTGFGAGGTAAGGYTGDGGPATAAKLNGPFALAFDSSGNLFFADGYNHVVRKVTLSGIITTVAGNDTAAYTGDGGHATAASLNNPVGVAFDRSGNMYIADDHNNAVRKVTPAGIITTFAGNHTAGFSGDGGPGTAAALNDPIGVGADAAGNVYIADAGNNVIRKVSADGIISTFAGNHTAGYSGDGGPATAAQLNSPERVTPDDSGNVYISDFFNNVVRKVNAAGVITAFAGIGTGAGSAGMTGAYSGDGGLATAAELYLPQGVAPGRNGRVYIADRGNQIIRVVGPDRDRTGISPITAGTAGGLLTYPNPLTTGNFVITLSSASTERAEIQVTGLPGNTIQRFSISTNKPTSVFLDAPRGIYILSATTAHGQWKKEIVLE